RELLHSGTPGLLHDPPRGRPDRGPRWGPAIRETPSFVQITGSKNQSMHRPALHGARWRLLKTHPDWLPSLARHPPLPLDMPMLAWISVFLPPRAVRSRERAPRHASPTCPLRKWPSAVA